MSLRWTSLLLCGALAACGGGSDKQQRPSAPDADADQVTDSQDCAPNDAARWQSLTFQSVDSDADGRRVNSSGQICSAAALPANYFAAAVASGDEDCDDANASQWQSLQFESMDEDADGRRVNASGQLCSGASLPANHFAAAVANGEEDCNDASESQWQSLAYAAIDADADGFTVPSTGSICTGDSLPSGYFDTAPTALVTDCDDASVTAWRLMTIYQDNDGDGVGSGRGTSTCIGNVAAAGFSLRGYDPLDDANDPSSGSTSDFDLPVWLLSAP